jgi:pyridoxamine 5'-phosphate oxidase
MTPQEIFDFVNKNPACFLATCADGIPHVRGMSIYRADKQGILFSTGAVKDLFKQLQRTTNVEFCFVNDNIQIRISGIATLENDLELKKEIVSKRPYLQPMIDKFGYEPLAIFRVTRLVATVWTMAENMAPKKFVELT